MSSSSEDQQPDGANIQATDRLMKAAGRGSWAGLMWLSRFNWDAFKRACAYHGVEFIFPLIFLFSYVIFGDKFKYERYYAICFIGITILPMVTILGILHSTFTDRLKK
jgi:hypothetical protein